MVFEQFYVEGLSQASYLIGDEETGRGVVVDPERQVERYLLAAEAHGLRIERVIETHVHADFVSGHLELAARTGSVVSYGEAVGETGFPIERLAHGQRIDLGRVTLEIRSTPGHTPESIVIVVYDGPTPWAVLTGDTLFVGAVGRPDLSIPDGDADVLARQLHRSLDREVLTLPDETLVFPAHGAGSACGRNLSTERSSTIGAERVTNPALASMTEDEFVAFVTDGLPLVPNYFAFAAARNRDLHPLLDPDAPVHLSLDEVLALEREGARLIDIAEPEQFAVGHLRHAVNLPLEGRFADVVGAVVEPGRQMVLVGDPGRAHETKVGLARIGFDTVVGQLAEPDRCLREEPQLAARSTRWSVDQLAARIDDSPDLQLIDVRNPGETASGTIPGATEIPLSTIVSRLDELDPRRPVAIYCAGGRRSATAASLLSASGFSEVADLVGGFAAWQAATADA